MRAKTIRQVTLLATLLLSGTVAAYSAPTPQAEPAAIVYSISGTATAGMAPDKKALKLFDWIPVGATIEVGPDSGVGLAFSNGVRYQLGPAASAAIGKSDLDSRSGPIQSLARVPSLPGVARLADKAAVGTKPAAIRIRGGTLPGMYPRSGVVTIADSAVLRFDPVAGATRYEAEVVDETGKVILRRETVSSSLPLPADALKPGSRYVWTLRALDQNGLVESARDQIVTLDAPTAHTRAALDETLRRGGDAGSLALLAGVDRDLGLLWEACDELRLAVALSPRDASLRENLKQLEQDLGPEAGK